MFNLYSETFSWSRACVVVIKPLVLLMVKSDAKLPMIDVRDKRDITYIYSLYEERSLRYKRTPKPYNGTKAKFYGQQDRGQERE